MGGGVTRILAAVGVRGFASAVQFNLDQNGANVNQSFGGPHPGICMFVFCDGSVKGVKVDVDIAVLTALATRAGGETISGNY